MAINKIEAKEIVTRQVIEKLDGFSLIEEYTQEFNSCFAFYYQNNVYIKSRDFRDMSVGVGPIIICKNTGTVFETGSAYSVEHYVKAFESCGNPHGQPTVYVSVYGWHYGANKVEATKLIKAESGLNLRDSKDIVDKALENEESRFSTASVEKSNAVCEELCRLGFKCKQLWSG